VRDAGVTILLVVLVIAAAGAGYIVGSNSSSTTTVTSTATAAFFPQDVGRELELQISTNETVVRDEGAIMVEVIMFNPESSNLTAVLGADPNSVIRMWNANNFPCGAQTVSPMFGFALFRGDVVQDNLSLASSPLDLTFPWLNCPPDGASQNFYVFLPNSSQAWAYYGGPSQPPTLVSTVENATSLACSSGGCSEGSSLNGFFVGHTFNRLTPGEYTLVAEGAWGQQAFCYFVVAP
jgi:hypothetical protein